MLGVSGALKPLGVYRGWAMSFFLTRGLWIPDPGFRNGIGDDSNWAIGSSMTGDIDVEPIHYGSGAGIKVKLNGTNFLANEKITSGLSPLGVSAAPFGTSNSLTVMIIAVVQTPDIDSGNVNGLLRGYVKGYSEGQVGQATSSAGNFANLDQTVFKYATKPKAVVAFVTLSIGSSTDWYKAEIYFKNKSTAGDAHCRIFFIGLGLPVSTSYFGDELSSVYAGGCAISTVDNPAGIGGQIRQYQFPWPLMDEDDKDLVDHCKMWNHRVPHTGVKSYPGSGTDLNYLSNGGSKQPMILAFDRENVKPAGYVNLNAPNYIMNPTGAWCGTNPKYGTDLMLIEKDR